jgi:hypothetical protein
MDFHTVLPLSFLYACTISPASPRSYRRAVIFFAVTAIQLWKETPSLGRSREGEKHKAGRKIFNFSLPVAPKRSHFGATFLVRRTMWLQFGATLRKAYCRWHHFGAISRDCTHCVASILMPLVYPFT